ncbi:hypothetical protein Ddye_027936 [Dipteronia dyeriana]|uniref:TIR domain-containing protein n=1 Tax=Dipteronia dyeriana TaxID=168575 RepID=A0AAD9WQZ4_9ROSI|nr:hypothetical protein Ddye_027936 [Dipteronia dyeriana]
MDYSSSITPPSFKYDVFLSFRAEDTPNGFTGHLYKALRDKQIEVCVDYEPERAYEWCLEELVHIIECREKYKQIVMPVFCDIERTDVRRQTKTFAAAFEKIEADYNDDSVLRWREALTEAANLSGYESQGFNCLGSGSDPRPYQLHSVDIQSEDCCSNPKLQQNSVLENHGKPHFIRTKFSNQ